MTPFNNPFNNNNTRGQEPSNFNPLQNLSNGEGLRSRSPTRSPTRSPARSRIRQDDEDKLDESYLAPLRPGSLPMTPQRSRRRTDVFGPSPGDTEPAQRNLGIGQVVSHENENRPPSPSPSTTWDPLTNGAPAFNPLDLRYPNIHEPFSDPNTFSIEPHAPTEWDSPDEASTFDPQDFRFPDLQGSSCNGGSAGTVPSVPDHDHSAFASAFTSNSFNSSAGNPSTYGSRSNQAPFDNSAVDDVLRLPHNPSTNRSAPAPPQVELPLAHPSRMQPSTIHPPLTQDGQPVARPSCTYAQNLPNGSASGGVPPTTVNPAALIHPEQRPPAAGHHPAIPAPTQLPPVSRNRGHDLSRPDAGLPPRATLRGHGRSTGVHRTVSHREDHRHNPLRRPSSPSFSPPFTPDFHSESCRSSPPPRQPRGRRRRGVTRAAIYETFRLVVDRNPTAQPHGKVCSTWREIHEDARAQGHWTESSWQTMRNLILRIIDYFEGRITTISADIKDILDGPDGASFGALLDVAAEQRRQTKGRTEKQKAGLRKKQQDDRVGGAEIREAAMRSMKKRTRSDLEDDSEALQDVDGDESDDGDDPQSQSAASSSSHRLDDPVERPVKRQRSTRRRNDEVMEELLERSRDRDRRDAVNQDRTMNILTDMHESSERQMARVISVLESVARSLTASGAHGEEDDTDTDAAEHAHDADDNNDS